MTFWKGPQFGPKERPKSYENWRKSSLKLDFDSFCYVLKTLRFTTLLGPWDTEQSQTEDQKVVSKHTENR